MEYTIDITPLENTGLIELRAGNDAVSNFEQTLGVAFPQSAYGVSEQKDLYILCLSPDQWLLRTHLSKEQSLFAKLRDAGKNQFFGLSIVSDHLSGYRIHGKDCRDVLAQACSLDLDHLLTGFCTRCTFARTTAVIQVIEQHRTYDVFIESSYNNYIKQWFEAARRW